MAIFKHYSVKFTLDYDFLINIMIYSMIAGRSKTMQLGYVGDYGTHYLYSPMTTENVENQNTCFQVEGTKDAPVKP